MTHHVRIRLDPGWAIGTVWTSAEWSALDDALAASVNGDGGGTYTPSADVIVGGAGVRLIAVTHPITGAHSVVSTTISAGALLVHGDSDYCVLGAGHTGTTASICSPVAAAVWAAGWTTFGFLSPFLIVSTQLGATARVPMRVHHGATLSTVTFPFQVDSESGIPAQLPRFGIFAQDAFGGTFQLATSAYQSIAAPASPSAWLDGSLTQTVTFTCDPSNPRTLMDTSKYTYFAQIIEVSGANALVGAIAYLDPTANFTNITDIRPR